MRKTMLGIGVALLLVGAIWALQGFGVLPGSMMTGQQFWANMGLLLLVAGGALIFFGARRGAARPPTKRRD